MQTMLKIAAVCVVVLMAATWLWGQYELAHTVRAAIAAGIPPLGIAALCWLAWLLRNRRRAAAGLDTTIAAELVRMRVVAVIGLIALCFIFSLILDLLGGMAHGTLARCVLNSTWDAICIAGMLFCGICVVGGGGR